MTGTVSIDLLRKQFATDKMGITAEGGLYTYFINKTGITSIKGTIVSLSDTDEGIRTTEGGETSAIGIVYENGVPDGQRVKVVISGIASVLVADQTSATTGNWVKVSDTVNGRGVALAEKPTDSTNLSQIGYAAQSINAGTNVYLNVKLQLP